MTESKKDLIELIKLAKKQGLKSLTVADVSFEFSDKAPPKRTRTTKGEKELPDVEPQYSDEDVLFFSVNAES